LEINNNFLVLLLQQMGCLLGLQVHIFQQFTQFAQFSITFAVDFELQGVKQTVELVFEAGMQQL
jgi:hypothetical protein